jgi:hypothetical protein
MISYEEEVGNLVDLLKHHDEMLEVEIRESILEEILSAVSRNKSSLESRLLAAEAEMGKF